MRHGIDGMMWQGLGRIMGKRKRLLRSYFLFSFFLNVALNLDFVYKEKFSITGVK